MRSNLALYLDIETETRVKNRTPERSGGERVERRRVAADRDRERQELRRLKLEGRWA